jgi:protein-L-isoaspartate(D-aspartate) O-methyltransferase
MTRSLRSRASNIFAPLADVSVTTEEFAMSSIADHRNFYASFVVRSVGSSDAKLIAAFTGTERERYVGPGPWSVFVNSGYISTVSTDPCLLYQDIVVSLAAERNINNGQPTLHARCLSACAPVPGESVVHIGVGTGYYTAILAALVERTGRVCGYEIEADLAERARANLQPFSNVEILTGSASEATLPSADVIYVNAGATHPLPAWLDALNIGGRLIFPLTENRGFGVMLLITRVAAGGYAAQTILPVAFIPCIGARDDAGSEALMTAIQNHSIFRSKSLHRGTVPDASACYAGSDWWLSSSAPKSAAEAC